MTRRQGLDAPERLRKATATKHGLTLADYDALLAAGQLWCTGCKAWHDRLAFRPAGHYCRESERNARRKQHNREWTEFRNWLLARVLVK